jgi:2-C-methyl-D-erythritol 4-phosphate cytidylyltransferase/2-C-methyl-D-erythritol 2,4-cyclodiphosphate synthase
MRQATSDVVILVVAAGRGHRFGGDMPKQYRALAGAPVLTHALRALAEAASEARLCVVIHPDDAQLCADAVARLPAAVAARLTPPVHGGATRQQSVRAGLESLREARPKIVLIHDAARPFATKILVEDAIAAARAHGAAVPGAPATDTLKQVDAAGFVVATPPRAALRAVQTPQAFDFDQIAEAHARAAAAAIDDLTDDGAVAEWAGHRVYVFAGDPANMKITTAADLAAAETRLLPPDIRTGQGYDVHAFGPGASVWLGGVEVAHDRGLVGHSDADVLIHAICDAIFGALADGDIGSHFPPSDPQWKGAPSRLFLEHAIGRVKARGGMIAHIDATLVCERPKIGPHRDAIRASLAAIMGLDLGRVAVKATTSEKLGFTGRQEGMAAMATATIRLPF